MRQGNGVVASFQLVLNNQGVVYFFRLALENEMVIATFRLDLDNLGGFSLLLVGAKEFREL
jgi:hypothetical protein